MSWKELMPHSVATWANLTGREKLRLVGLDEIKRAAEMEGMTLVPRPRLSVQPVTDFEFDRIIDLAHRPGPGS